VLAFEVDDRFVEVEDRCFDPARQVAWALSHRYCARAVQPDFQHMITVIVIAGLAVFGIGGTLLFFSFRAFGTARRGDIKHIVLLGAALAFILISCVALLVWSTMQK
jgi:hypothetical protein